MIPRGSEIVEVQIGSSARLIVDATTALYATVSMAHDAAIFVEFIEDNLSLVVWPSLVGQSSRATSF